MRESGGGRVGESGEGEWGREDVVDLAVILRCLFVEHVPKSAHLAELVLYLFVWFCKYLILWCHMQF